MERSQTQINELLQKGVESFKALFGGYPEIAGCAPGRVNLIGEHTDYNDGFVLPMALPMVTVVIGKKNNSDDCRIKTLSENSDNPSLIIFSISERQSLKPGNPKWANYIKGVITNFKGNVPGFDAVITTSVPMGGGLSSSASLEVATYTFLEALTEDSSQKLEDKALMCQKAEHEFAGVPCGIMDQYISSLGKEGHALLIDCRTLEAQLVPINDPNLVFVITNSNVRHELGGGEYAIRRKQCEEAAQYLGKSSLRDASLGQLESLKLRDAIPDIIYRRARHVIGEIARTIQGATLLASGDSESFGQLMYLSHQSLRDDYEVSCAELDELVEIAKQVDGVLGSRMTGGGFGGCTVTLVTKSKVDDLINRIKENYSQTATFYIAKPSEGTHVLSLNEYIK
ncbi:galactokinase-like [Lycorma delicatula]|uniref:galactokinase-like n=1 Tax=Lycorma delicatula TaxID=130591 RepID=UPI003F518E5D